MASVNQYVLTHQEAITLMIKDANIHDGKWELMINYAINAGGVNLPPGGPQGGQLHPGVIIAVTGLGIQRLSPEADIPPGAIVVDAAEVNPKRK